MEKLKYILRFALIHLYCFCFYLIDSFVPKKRDLWVIASHLGPIGNPRFFAEHLLNTQDHLKIYLFSLEKRGSPSLKRTEEYLKERYGVTILKRKSWGSLCIALQASAIFVTHDLIRDVGFPLRAKTKDRVIINLWHGIAMKKHWLIKQYDVLSAHRVRAKQFHHVIASSAADALGKAAIFHKTLDEILVTGMPRNDILLDFNTPLPPDLLSKERELEEELQGRSLILYAPTWRGEERGMWKPFEDESIASLRKVLERYGAVMGLRLHERDRDRYWDLVKRSPCFLNVAMDRYPETQILLKSASLLITDYSSIWLDYLLTRRPIIAYWPDSSSYHADKGLLWDIPHLFPGDIVYSQEGLIKAIEKALNVGSAIDPTREALYTFTTSFFHQFNQGLSSQRLYEAIVKRKRKAR